MDFETWDRATLIEAIKTEMAAEAEYFRNRSGRLQLKEYSDDVLQKNTNIELQDMYWQLKQKDKKFLQEYATEKEKYFIFNRPESDANFIYWARCRYWSIW